MSLLVALALAGVTPACADPAKAFDDFVERSPPPPPPGSCPDAYILQPPGALDGDYLLTLTASVNTAKPIVFLAKLTTVAGGAGIALGMTIHPLSKDDRMTPVGDTPRDVPAVPVAEDGTFFLDLKGLEIPKDANALTPADAEADIVMEGNICGDGAFICGDADGETTKPVKLKLEGSTFSFQRITDPAKYPELILDCMGTTLDP